MDKSWVHHVEYYENGAIGIDRSMGQLPIRLYTPTPSSMNRLEWATGMWTRWPASRQDASNLKYRAMAPMRRYT